MSESVTIDRKLIDIYDEAYYLYDSFETRQDPTNSNSFQADIKKCIKLFEDATRLVSLCGVFSTNESHEEISTNDLRYLLLPFFLAQLNLKLCGDDRKHCVEIAEIYYKDFLKRCLEYGLYEEEKQIEKTEQSVSPRTELEQLQKMATQREQKLAKYREKKELADQIKQLKIAISAEHIDDDVKREFYSKLLQSCIIEAKDELVTIDQEKAILEHLAKRDSEGGPQNLGGARPKHPLHASTKPLKPIIITKDLVQKAVYGAGYPSLPTMTVEEFYESRVNEGIWMDPEQTKQAQKMALQNRTDEMEKELEEQDAIEKEEKVEQDDPAYLERTRAMDEWKDDHRRGEGNRYNRS